jgi:hypothetical protein
MTEPDEQTVAGIIAKQEAMRLSQPVEQIRELHLYRADPESEWELGDSSEPDAQTGALLAYLRGANIHSAEDAHAMYERDQELSALFELQQTRMQEATEAWRHEDPSKVKERELVSPDLGDLLAWLLHWRDRAILAEGERDDLLDGSAPNDPKLRMAVSALLEHNGGACVVYHGYSECPQVKAVRDALA